MDESIRSLIFQAIDQTISAEDFERLQNAIEQSDEVRADYLNAVSLCESLSDIAAVEDNSADAPKSASVHTSSEFMLASHQTNRRLTASRWARTVVAPTAIMIVGAAAFWFGLKDGIRRQEQFAGREEITGTNSESVIAGHATLRRSVDIRWSEKSNSYREGDVLPAGMLQFDQGVAEIDFFCGATLIVEGPATLNVESDWSVQVASGRLRASVPPAARGFMVMAAGSTIIDLGTEFALDVGAENAHVEVIDGEVELRGGEYDGNHLTTGQRRWLKGSGNDDSLAGLSTTGDLQRRRGMAQAQRFINWQVHSQQLRADDRLIAYYPIAESSTGRIVPNVAASGSERDGQTVGLANRVDGRFGEMSSGFEFDRPGSRVRVRIDGEFRAFTFACWTKIDSLEHRYNALFMGDGYENGEPHWQIRDDGCLMFSVMVDDSKEIIHRTPFDEQPVKDAGLHRVYLTEPFWDISKSGQWFHIAAVYDPVGREVVQFVNGEELSRQEIIDRFHVESLRIGPAEIGNWGQPFRKTPWFAVRNLNGTIDELAIFNAALTSDEIRNLYEQGRPLGY
tara:strand:+ start:96325 stop:98022 length:1698 start_codon:yes stop_codon:yes gene_type:complete